MEAVDKLRHIVASVMNEWGPTTVRPGSTLPANLAVTEYPLFIHTLFAGLMPPFSPFFLVVLEHYQIQLLHLQPNSVVILDVFAFLCEAFLGVPPSVALFRCFYSLRITAGEQRSGCVSFRFCEAMASEIIPMEVMKKVEDFRKRWVYMDLRQASPLFEVPTAPAVKHAHWEGIKITDDSIAPLVLH